jgi:hypothetical protein
MKIRKPHAGLAALMLGATACAWLMSDLHFRTVANLPIVLLTIQFLVFVLWLIISGGLKLFMLSELYRGSIKKLGRLSSALGTCLVIAYIVPGGSPVLQPPEGASEKLVVTVWFFGWLAVDIAAAAGWLGD